MPHSGYNRERPGRCDGESISKLLQSRSRREGDRNFPSQLRDCGFFPIRKVRWIGPESLPNAVAELQGCHGTSPVPNQRHCNGVTQLLPNAPCAGATVQKHSEKQGESRTGELGFEPRQADPESAVLPLHHSPKLAENWRVSGPFGILQEVRRLRQTASKSVPLTMGSWTSAMGMVQCRW
jgi:hypothetical protein